MRVYRIFNLLSLDVALGAVILALFFSRQLEVIPRVPGMLLLGLAVWIIYTVDRLLDIRQLSGLAATERHRFHQRYQVTLWVLAGFATVLSFIILFSMREVVIQAGVILAAMVGLYMALQKWLPVKEFVIALLYTAGILLPSITVRSAPLLTHQYLMMGEVFLLALINLLIFAGMETKADQQDGHHSFTTRWGYSTTVRILHVLLAISFTLAAFLVVTKPTLDMSMFVFMNLMLFIIFERKEYFSQHDRYRLWGDGVFLIPLVALFQ